MIEGVLNSFIKTNMQPITGMDAAFLHAETPTSPMHIGGIAIVEGSLKFDAFREMIRKRLHQMPRLRKKLAFVPLSIDYPYWVDDPDFDLDLHLRRVALPAPGGWAELREMAAQIYSEHLDRSRALWEFTFVEGLDSIPQLPKGSVAVISKIHHVAIDGMGGVGLMSIMFDTSDKPKELPEPPVFNPPPLPNELSMVLNSTATFAKNPFKLPRLLGNIVSSGIRTSMLSTQSQFKNLPTTPFSAPRTPLNGTLAARRKWNLVLLELDRVKALKSKMGTTFNDVILAICSGALRKYLKEKKQLPDKSLVAGIPVSIRTKEDSGAIGNRISNMVVQLETQLADPVERLEAIHENTVRSKTYHKALGAKTMSDMAEAVPFGLANQAYRIYSRYKLSQLHKPIYNVMITNVPGPPIPLYMQGHKMVAMSGMAPIIDGMGLIITVFSYNGSVSISSTSDAKTMPDIDTFSRYILESANELEEAVLNYEKEKAPKKPKKNPVAESDILFDKMKSHLKEHAEHIKPGKGIFQFNVTGDAPTHWRIDLNKSPGSVRKMKAKNPDVTLTISDEHLMRLARGKLNFQTAFIQGRLKVEGDNAKAMSLAKIISKIPKLED